jgi:hypothetical protein
VVSFDLDSGGLEMKSQRWAATIAVLGAAGAGLVAGFALPAVATESTWWSGFGLPVDGGQGVSERVTTLCEHNGQLHAGGWFTSAGGNPNVRWIGRFDGNVWRRVGGGTNGPVHALFSRPSDGSLLVGGSFTQAGTLPVANVARFEGGTWTSLSTGVDAPVIAFAEHAGILVVAGDFTVAGGMAAGGIAGWDGSSWVSFDGGFDRTGGSPYVEAATDWNGQLWAGGWFDEANGTPLTGLARWNGAQWESAGNVTASGGCGSPVEALLQLPGGELVVVGALTSIDGVPCNGVARWDGSGWTGLGGALNAGAVVEDAALLEGDLVIVGRFSGPGGILNVARWNGSDWDALDAGLSSWELGCQYHALAILDGDLYAGGFFQTAGAVPSYNVARWMGTPAVGTPALATPLPDARLAEISPNPFQSGTRISFELARPMEVSLAVFDVAGRQVRMLRSGGVSAGRHGVDWDGRDAGGNAVSAGIYLVRFSAEGVEQSRKVTVVRQRR